jgi:hypothetical protein
MGDVKKKIFLLNKVYFQTLQTDIFWTLFWPFSCDYSFWLRDLKFGMCIRNPRNKTCWKNDKDLLNRAPKNKHWNHIKKTDFAVFAENFCRPWMKLKIFFANFQILGLLGCQGWVVIPQNVKKVKITAPYCTYYMCIEISYMAHTCNCLKMSTTKLIKLFTKSAHCDNFIFSVGCINILT